MIQVGLLNFYRESPVFNVLQGKVRIFDYLNKLLFSKRLLFTKPGAFDFGGAKTIATPCAADDLDLFNSYSSEQIEFQDFKTQESEPLNSNLSYYPYTGGENGVAPSHQNYGITAPLPAQVVDQQQNHTQAQPQADVYHHHTSAGAVSIPSSQYNVQHEHRHEVHHSAPISTNVNSQQQDYEQMHFIDSSLPGSISHFNLNMNHTDLINDQYFNDFKPTLDSRDSEYQSIYGSSSESYVSPLDDEFFKKLSPESIPTGMSEDPLQAVEFDGATASNKKRTFEITHSPNVNFYDVNSIFNDYLIDNSRYNNNNNNNRGNSNNSVSVKQESESYRIPIKQEQTQFQAQGHEHGASRQLHSNSIDRNESISSTASSMSSVSLPISKKMRIESDLTDAKYKCHYCDAKFKVKGYLTRHLKKHNSSKAFVCPFYHESPTNHCNPSKKNVVAGTKCHPTGGFSRRDTYKTHLKALHFIYPPGTKSNERNKIGGNCAGCFVYFDNNLKWLEDHIEKGMCSKIEKN
ncbi:transcriptional regulator Stp3p [[Candida] railenensis]|uniref:Transcriptional regulator Stp3p n=1 Tax=[Candida] railenensis TaxID=45579 RepID=A0A9P0VWK4_9ASCO|nr:transcriptional regulator Stp3p [[Candida] railenensis]